VANVSANEIMKVLHHYLLANDLALEIILVTSAQNLMAEQQ
jgi:hypothetical protein